MEVEVELKLKQLLLEELDKLLENTQTVYLNDNLAWEDFGAERRLLSFIEERVRKYHLEDRDKAIVKNGDLIDYGLQKYFSKHLVLFSAIVVATLDIHYQMLKLKAKKK